MQMNLTKKIGLFISPLAISPVVAFSSTNNQVQSKSNQYFLTNVNKKVDVLPQGTNWKNVNKEQRWFSHSELTPTGIFVPKNTWVYVEFDQEIDQEILINFKVRIGQWKSYSHLNGGARWDLMTHDLKVDPLNFRRGIIISKLEGMFYLVNRSQTKTYSPKISASNVVKIPTIEVGKTNLIDFIYDYSSQTIPPFIELVGKNVFATVDTKIFDTKMRFSEWVGKYSPHELIKGWDKIYDLSNRVSGLNNDPTSVHYKNPNKVQLAIISGYNGWGYATSEHSGYSLGAGWRLLTTYYDQFNWLLWHEVGHTYQNRFLKLDGYTEVTVNINSLWIQEHLNLGNKLFESDLAQERSNVKAFLTKKDKTDNEVNSLGIWEKLFMFWQLHMAYGKEFYPQLHQSYRLLSPHELPINEYQKRQTFIILASKVTQRNLIPFFEKWSIYADQNTINQVKDYPLPSKDIWNNIIDNNFGDKTIVDYILS